MILMSRDLDERVERAAVSSHLESPPYRIAIACSGLGHVNRGYESIMRDIFEQVRGHASLALFKGFGAESNDEHVVRCLRRTSSGGRLLASFSERRAYHLENWTFARSLFRSLRQDPCDVVFVPDYRVARALWHLRRRLPRERRFSLALHNSAPYTLRRQARHPFDLVQQVTAPAQDAAIRAGLSNSRLVPIPVDTGRFSPGSAREALRAELGLPARGPLVLCAAALVPFKRIDLLVEAVADLRDADPLPSLLVVGHPGEETARVQRLAEARLGPRAVFRTYPWERMPELYRLADVFALPSRREGFGMALLEAMASGVPVVTQDDPVRRWIVGDAGMLVECREPGSLSKALSMLLGDAELRNRLGRMGCERAERVFSWEVLRPRYIAFFEEAAARRGR